MSVLYRRFTLVAATIAALGVMTSILIQETRRDTNALPPAFTTPAQASPFFQPQGSQKFMRLSCGGIRTCSLAVSGTNAA